MPLAFSSFSLIALAQYLRSWPGSELAGPAPDRLLKGSEQNLAEYTAIALEME